MIRPSISPASIASLGLAAAVMAIGTIALIWAGSVSASSPIGLALVFVGGMQLFLLSRQRRQTDLLQEQLRQSEDELSLLCAQADFGLARVSEEGLYLETNAPFAAMLGCTPAELKGRVAKSGHDDAVLAEPQRLGLAVRSGKINGYCCTLEFASAGRTRRVRSTVTAIRNADGTLRHLVLLAEDLTAQMEAERFLAEREQQLRESEERFGAIFEQAPVGIGYLSLDGRWQMVNRRVCEIIQYEPEKLIGESMLAVPPRPQWIGDAPAWKLPPEMLAAERRKMEENWLALIAHGQRVQREERFDRLDGSTVWLRTSTALVRGSDHEPHCVVVIVEDITELKNAETTARQLALYDPLTELPNRRLLQDRLQQSLHASQRTGQHGALLFIDLDNFKHLNDARGHHEGDRLLKDLAERLRQGVREQDTVGRLGGDEFVVLLNNLGASPAEASYAAERVACKLKELLAQPFMLGKTSYFPSASIGVSQFPRSGISGDDLLKEADTAMYRAKRLRNSIAFYAPEMQDMAEQRLTLERDLHSAMACNQLRLFFQPQVDAHGEVTGAETLLRWQHPVNGLMTPGDFVPVAEDCGLIVPIGRWVLRTACDILQRTANDANAIGISVNVSPRQFRERSFVAELGELLQQYEIEPARLTLEITEGLMMGLGDEVTQRMTEVEALGVRISIDDFGTGYSSLAYLKRLPLHELKIDRTFISDLPDDLNDAAIVEAILSMANHLGLTVVAEGVETPQQLAFLRARGCRHFQGYHLGRPVPAEEFLQSLVLTADNAPQR